MTGRRGSAGVGDRRLWRGLVALYPPSWRARYAQEMLALLEDSAPPTRPARVRAAASLVFGAAGAWLHPARQLHPAASRVRASVSTLLVVWVALSAAALVFGQLNEDQATQTVTPGHPITGGLFAGYTLASHISVGVLLAACAPLFAQLARAGLRQRDRHGLVLLSAPVVVPVLFLLALAAISRLVRHPHGGVGVGWFGALTALGLLAGATAVSGPLLALRRFAPTGRAVRLALYGLGAAVALMGAALAATVANLGAVHAWGVPTFAHAPVLVIAVYSALIVAALAVALTSGARGLAAAHAR